MVTVKVVVMMERLTTIKTCGDCDADDVECVDGGGDGGGSGN